MFAFDLQGNLVKKKPMDHPYSYDPFVIHRSGPNEMINSTLYSDRLFEWDHEKYNSLCEKYFGNTGQMFHCRKPEVIEAFLKDYCNNENLKLIVILQGANQSSGYPYFVFLMNDPNEN